MAFQYADRTLEQASAPSGTGAFALSTSAIWQTFASLPGPWQTFATVGHGGDQFYYEAYDNSGNSEAGIGTYATGASNNTLARSHVYTSSSGNGYVTFASTTTVFCTLPAEYLAPIVTAATGTSSGTATVLYSRVNYITGGASGGVIPAYLAECVIVNRSGGQIAVYPTSGAQIESLGVGASALLYNNTTTNLRSQGSGQWWAT